MEGSLRHNYYDEEPTQFRGFNQFSLDQNDMINTYAHAEPVYRSISIMPAYHAIESHHYTTIMSPTDFGSFDKPVYHRENSKKNLSTYSLSPTSSSHSGARKITTLGVPDLLIKTNFSVKTSIEIIQIQLERYLRETSGVSYELSESRGQVIILSHTRYTL